MIDGFNLGNEQLSDACASIVIPIGPFSLAELFWGAGCTHGSSQGRTTWAGRRLTSLKRSTHNVRPKIRQGCGVLGLQDVPVRKISLSAPARKYAFWKKDEVEGHKRRAQMLAPRPRAHDVPFRFPQLQDNMIERGRSNICILDGVWRLVYT